VPAVPFLLWPCAAADPAAAAVTHLQLELLKMDPTFLNRNVNQGFSGGEKKRNEILQLAVLDVSRASDALLAASISARNSNCSTGSMSSNSNASSFELLQRSCSWQCLL
jgi:hypothetical protein